MEVKIKMNDELYHFGVKGMKWGVRRKRNNSTPNTRKHINIKTQKKEPVEIHDDYKNAHSKKSVVSMSDAELRARINRIQMEEQYAKLAPTGIRRGQTYTQNLLKTAGTIATATGTAITIYNNIDKISKLAGKSN